MKRIGRAWAAGLVLVVAGAACGTVVSVPGGETVSGPGGGDTVSGPDGGDTGSDGGETTTGPATFACGGGGGGVDGGGPVTCHAGQVCTSWEEEVQPPDTLYQCLPMPASCADNPTCDCLTAAVCGSQVVPNEGDLWCGCDATGCFIPCLIP